MSTPSVIISGASGGAPNRLEINDFVKNDKFFSLYVQALQLMYTKEPQSDFSSFFQIAGIHGLPYVPWDNATGPAFDPRSQWGGYCTHGSVLFPTWHRPYVMLYEQIMQQRAKEVAATYTTADAADWVKAAEDIRQPYWDWAANSVPPDQVIALKTVEITGPDGQKVSVANPLFHYEFHPVDSSFPSPYRSWPSTLRQPTSTRPNATDNVTRLKRVLQSSQNDIRSSIYSMLTRVHTWTAFSNHTVGDGGSSSNSIEAIHDGLHVDIGGNGHMSDPSVAAFDPIFFLHHCNVDRMLSLWSALNPGVWINQGDSEDGTFILPPEEPVDGTTPLTPFWSDESSFWTSSATTNTATLGYTYPDFNGLDMSNTSAVQTAIGNIVNRLYGNSIFGRLSAAPSNLTTSAFTMPSSASALAANVPLQPKAEEAGAGTAARVAAPAGADADAAAAVESERSATISHGSHPPPARGGLVPPNIGMYEWTARIEFKKYELGCSFSVFLFLGTVPEDPEEWHVSDNFVGAHHAFVNTATAQCSNCRTHPDLVEEGFVHLNQAIAEHSGAGSLDPEFVEPYLTKELHWRVQKADGTEASLESLEVSVYGTPLSYPPGAMFPVPGQRRRANGVTRGRRGGTRAT